MKTMEVIIAFADDNGKDNSLDDTNIRDSVDEADNVEMTGPLERPPNPPPVEAAPMKPSLWSMLNIWSASSSPL